MVKVIIAYNYVKRSFKDFSGLLIMIIMPIVFTFVNGTALEGVANPKIDRFEILYVNEDKGEFGKIFDDFIKSGKVSELFSIKEVPQEYLTDLMEKGDHPAAVIIGKSFSSNIFNNKISDIRIIAVPGKDIEAGIVNSVIDSYVSGINKSMALDRLILRSRLDIKDVRNMKEAANEALKSEFVKEINIKHRPKVSVLQYFASSMLVMFMLFTGALGASNMIREREEHLLMRTMAAPVKEFDIMAGKFLGNVFLALIQGSVVIMATKLLYNVDWGNSPLGIVLITLSVVFVSASMAFLLSMILNSAKMATGVISVVMLLMSFLSGSFTPFEGNDVLTAISYFTINKWAFESYQAVMSGGSIGSVYQNLLVLIATGIVMAAAAVIMFKKRGALYE